MARFRTPLYATAELLGALRTAAAATPGQLTQAAYVRWLATRPPRSEPSRGIIVKRLGSWSAAVRAAGLPTAPRGGPRATPPPPAPDPWHGRPRHQQFTDEEMLVAVRAAARATGRGELSRAAYDRHRDAQRRRAVAGSQAIGQRFGGWPAALERAGLVTPPAPVAALADDTARALRLFAATRPAAALTRARYDAFRKATAAALPRSAAIVRAHGTWREALAVAGLDAATRQRDRLLGALVASAALDPAGGASLPAYQERSARDGRLPSYRTFYRTFESWSAAIGEAGLTPPD